MMNALVPNSLKLLIAGLVVAVVTMLVSPTAHAQGCSGDTNGDGRVDGTDLATVLGQWGNCPPSITSVDPAQGSVLGGTVINITGTGLAATLGVTVGGTACTNLLVLSPTQIRATTPPGEAGPSPIAVTTAHGTSLAPTPFTYALQSVSSVTPSKGPYLGGTAITIQGAYLSAVTSVTIGGVPVASFDASSSSLITAITPPGSVGSMDIVITGAKGSITVPSGFTFVAPPPWATVLDWVPDPVVVTSVSLREAIIATGLPWRVRDNSTQIEMVLIPPGSFQRGCSASNVYGCLPDELPVHPVTLTNAFYLGRYEVTQAQWQAQIGSNPSWYRESNGFPNSHNRPVETVSWTEVQGFLSATALRLPTEAEWEYACRAGTTTPFHSGPGFPNGTATDGSIGSIAWCYPGNCSSGAQCQTWPVGGKAANALGIHDMLGNVWEWCSDRYGTYQMEPQSDPTGPSTGMNRVARGGSYYDGTNYVRASCRAGLEPDYTIHLLGFRVARNP